MGLYQQRHCQFGRKSTEMGWNVGRLSDVWDSTRWDSRAVNMPYPSKKGKNDPGWFTDQQGSHCHQRPRHTGPDGKAVPLLISEHGATFLVSVVQVPLAHGLRSKALPVAEGMLLPHRAEKARPPQWAGGQSILPKRIILQPSELMEFALLSFRLAWDPSPLLSDFSLLEWDRLFYACPTTVSSVLFHRIASKKEFCLRMNNTSSLSDTWFRWYLDDTLDL